MNGELSASAMDVLLTEFKTHDLSYWVRHIKYIHAFGEMYEASCDPSVFARWLHFNQILYTHRADRQTPPAMDTRRGNIVPPAWMFRWVKVSPEHLHAEVAINGVYGYSLAWWARHVVENPDLHARYGKIAVDYTNTVLEMLEFFNTRDLLSKYENNHPDPTYSYWSVSESAPEPFNIVHLLAKAMLETHRVLRSPYYRNHSGRDTKRMAEQTALLPAIVSGLHRRFMFRTRTIGQTLLWPYSEARAGWDDASHGGITAHYYTLLFRERDAINAHLATRNQVALSSTDMSRIARTFVENVYREGGQRPGLRQLIDGTDWPTNHEKYDWYSGDTFPWLQLSPFDQDVLPRAEHVATTTNTKSGSREFFHYECHTGLLRFKHHRGFNVQIARFGRYAWGGLRQAYETTANVLVGDFNGDRRHDLLRVDSRGWSLAAGATDHWRKIGPAGVPFSELLVGDFDGDGRDDLLHANPTTGWRISDGATGNWRRVGSSGYAAREFRVVDFDGDGRADLFQATGTEWRVSYSDGTSMTGWVYTGGSSALHAELALGDFNGDGVTDIFNVANGRGRVSWGRRGRGTGNEHSSWVNYATCPYGIADILVGDFNKDGKDDLLAIGTSAWWVSLSGTSTWTSWSTVAARGDSAASLRIGDFDGDGADDALRFEQRR
ncbi:MAG: VCBS repeat-containing protein [Planctomycetes bacterium]|nr:VCBS repeat-containing protein [Planctomycetota bacterium]